jgi:hypothetical protein
MSMVSDNVPVNDSDSEPNLDIVIAWVEAEGKKGDMANEP